MKVCITQQFLKDLRLLSKPLQSKCEKLCFEVGEVEPTSFRQDALPGWRLHRLSGSPMVTLSVNMNYRVLARIDGGQILFFRVVKHDIADRANVNRNDKKETFGELSGAQLQPSQVYEALQIFGLPTSEIKCFRECSTEDDLLEAVANVSKATGDFALNLYGSSGIAIPQARYRPFHKDETFDSLLENSGSDWEIYLHPSQAFITEMAPSFRAAIGGSAGTGKTICAWHRTKRLTSDGVSVGYVCPNESALEISKEHLRRMGGSESYFLVAKQPDELIQIAEAVEHVIIDEAQEIPTTWLLKLGEKMPDDLGLTLFYDLNQLGGNVPVGNESRYRRRITDWKNMLHSIPRLQKLILSVNYRNAREIAEYYLALLSEALPAKPFSPVPVFEAGQVVEQKVNARDLGDQLVSLVHRLLRDHQPKELCVVTLHGGEGKLCQALKDRGLPVTNDLAESGIVVTTASRIRGHERKVVIVIMSGADALRKTLGRAINAYIAMSRATMQLIVIKVLP